MFEEDEGAKSSRTEVAVETDIVDRPIILLDEAENVSLLFFKQKFLLPL